MKVLVLRHEPFEHLGSFAAALEDRKVTIVYHDLGEPIALNGCHRLMIMGGPMSANDPLPGLAGEIELIGQAIRTDVPMLGICLGAQLIAKALGARVYPNPRREIGWEPVYLTPEAHADPLFSGLASPTTFFHWHGEAFDLPAGAQWLAYSEKCRHQAFRFGRCVYGIQFHPEITPEMIADWCAQPANCGDAATLETPIDPYAADSRPLARKILNEWLELF
jgi:GMP synthase-like glutamine amidotransferase